MANDSSRRGNREIAIGIGVGTAAGAAIGSVMGDIGIGVGVGLALGLAAGSAWKLWRKPRSRTVRPVRRPNPTSSKRRPS